MLAMLHDFVQNAFDWSDRKPENTLSDVRALQKRMSDRLERCLNPQMISKKGRNENSREEAGSASSWLTCSMSLGRPFMFSGPLQLGAWRH
jgi:hypothetical protein